MSSLRFYGSINITELIKLLNGADSSFVKTEKNKNVYCNITAWVNEVPDQYGNSMSIHTSPPEGSTDEKVYIANLKVAPNSIEGLKEGDIPRIDLDEYKFKR